MAHSFHVHGTQTQRYKSDHNNGMKTHNCLKIIKERMGKIGCGSQIGV
jgi:hypothetical protein